MYKAEILADSISPNGNRLTTFKVTYPRIIHAEMCRHRMLSRNTASSRAIPFKKMVKDVEENPFIPIAWQKDHKGMQGTEYFTSEWDIKQRNNNWIHAKDAAIATSTLLHEKNGVTKQLCNRLLEPFVWVTEIISGTEWENFFELRCPAYFDGNTTHKSKKDYCKKNDPNKNKTYSEEYFRSINDSQADIHIQAIAELMWDAKNESIPKKLKSGEWHIPDLGHRWDYSKMVLLCPKDQSEKVFDNIKIKIATAHCAKISYDNFGTKVDYEADIRLYDRLFESGHWSPFEHIARVMSENEYNLSFTHKIGDHGESGWCKNFRGFIQYRTLVEKDLWKWIAK